MQVFVVGGAVRDLLLGRDPKDMDFVVVGSTPDEMIKKGFTKVGADFPVFLDDRGQEFALARTERKIGSGHKGFETEFDPSVTLEDDLVRRDLTINAMAVRVEDWDDFCMGLGEDQFLIDPFGGADDLHRRKLRHVSDAFGEDPLRVLRVARFAARFGFGISRHTLKLMSAMVERGELNELTPERVWSEMSRAMTEQFPAKFFQTIMDVHADHVLCSDSFVFAGLESRLSLLRLSGANEITMWMGIFFDLDQDIVEDFIKQHRMPSVHAEGIRFGLEMSSAFFNGPDEIMKVCAKFRLWKEKFLLGDFRKLMDTLEPDHSAKLQALLTAINKASKIGFESLSQKERDTLTGPSIGKAIEAKRRDIIVKWSTA